MFPKRIALGLGLVLVACSSDAPDAAQPGSFKPDAGSIVDAGSIDATVDASSDGSSDAGLDAHADGPIVYVPGPSVCKTTLTLGAATDVTTGMAIASITPDELTLAYFSASGLFVADRALATDAFGAPHAVSGSFSGATLTPDGLALVATASDGKSFFRFERDDRATDFEQEITNHYDAITNALAVAEMVTDPVLAHGDQTLFYSVIGGASKDTVHLATRISVFASYDPGQALAFPELRQIDDPNGPFHRRPTGVATDFQTLFFWDESTSTQKIGRLKGTIGFFQVADLGAHRGAQPNDALHAHLLLERHVRLGRDRELDPHDHRVAFAASRHGAAMFLFPSIQPVRHTQPGSDCEGERTGPPLCRTPPPWMSMGFSSSW